MQTGKTYGLSLPIQLFEKIDTQRGDVSRSRFISRLLEKSQDDNANVDVEKNEVLDKYFP